ncbi:MAG: DUF933 domain-containing protein, partial [Ignavibacteria bacterium]
IDPKRDVQIVEMELILKDLETLESKIHKTEKFIKTGDKKIKEEYSWYLELKKELDSGRLAKYFIHDFKTRHAKDHEVYLFDDLHLLTDKHILYVANVDDKHLNGNEYSKVVAEIAEKENEKAIVLSAEMESELAQLEQQEKAEFMKELGIKETGLDKLISTAYKLLGLITFYTRNEKEVHAWNIHKGTKAPQAAGKIHTDFEKGFIKAEVIAYDDLIKYGSEHVLREKGLLAYHGRDYVVQDGDIIYFRFHV